MKKALIIIGVVLVVGLIVIANWGSIFRTVIPAQPVVVSSEAISDVVGLLDYSIKVKGVVSNKGGDGTVVVEATVYQGKKEWTKTESFYMSSYDTKNFKMNFPEAKLNSKEITYNIDAYALGTQ